MLTSHLVFFLICMFTNGIGVFMLTTSLTREIKTDLASFSALVKSDPNPIMYLKPLYALIEFHSILKRCAWIKCNQLHRLSQSHPCWTIDHFSFINFRFVRNLSEIFQTILGVLVGASFVTITTGMLSIKSGMVCTLDYRAIFFSIFQHFYRDFHLSESCRLTTIWLCYLFQHLNSLLHSHFCLLPVNCSVESAPNLTTSTIQLTNSTGIYFQWMWKKSYQSSWQMHSSRWISCVLAVSHVIEILLRRLTC